jgi:hypothetical protein
MKEPRSRAMVQPSIVFSNALDLTQQNQPIGEDGHKNLTTALKKSVVVFWLCQTFV